MPQARLASYCDALQASFERSCANEDAAATGATFEVAGVPVRLRFANSGLERFITPALNHLRTNHAPADALTISLWDGEDSGNAPQPPWDVEGELRKKSAANGRSYERIIQYRQDQGIWIAFQAGDRLLNALDADRRRALFCTPDVRQLPYHERSAPLRAIFEWWLAGHGSQLLHAAAIGTAEGVVLIVGNAGAGKSTTALACLGSGLQYASDDHVAVRFDGTPYVHSTYSSGKLNKDSLSRLPALVPAVVNRERLGHERALLFLHDCFPEKLIKGFPLAAILVPRITDRRAARIVPLSGARGLAALAPSTVRQSRGAGRQAFFNIGRIAKQVPTYALEMGRDLESVPGAILELLDRNHTIH